MKMDERERAGKARKREEDNPGEKKSWATEKKKHPRKIVKKTTYASLPAVSGSRLVAGPGDHPLALESRHGRRWFRAALLKTLRCGLTAGNYAQNVGQVLYRGTACSRQAGRIFGRGSWKPHHASWWREGSCTHGCRISSLCGVSMSDPKFIVFCWAFVFKRKTAKWFQSREERCKSRKQWNDDINREFQKLLRQKEVVCSLVVFGVGWLGQDNIAARCEGTVVARLWKFVSSLPSITPYRIIQYCARDWKIQIQSWFKMSILGLGTHYTSPNLFIHLFICLFLCLLCCCCWPSHWYFYRMHCRHTPAILLFCFCFLYKTLCYCSLLFQCVHASVVILLRLQYSTWICSIGQEMIN